MANIDVNATAEQQSGLSSQHLAQFGDSLKGAGAEAWEAYRTLSEQTSALPNIGRTVADEVARLRADTSLPRDHRYGLANEKRAAAEIVIKKMHESAQASVAKLEGALINGLIPKPHADASQRALHRQELANVLGNKQGSALEEAARHYLGTNPSHDAELLSDYGRSLFHGRGASDRWPGLQEAAVEKLSTMTGGTERQQAARKALADFKARNITGRASAFTQAAWTHLKRDDT